jgi:hypothetical protein
MTYSNKIGSTFKILHDIWQDDAIIFHFIFGLKSPADIKQGSKERKYILLRRSFFSN